MHLLGVAGQRLAQPSLDLVELTRLVVGVQEVGAVAHDAASIVSRRAARPRWAWALTEPGGDAERVGDLGLAEVERSSAA